MTSVETYGYVMVIGKKTYKLIYYIVSNSPHMDLERNLHLNFSDLYIGPKNTDTI